MKLDIKINIQPVQANLAKFQRQIPFAIAQGINATLTEAQGEVVNRLLPEKFTLRSRGAPWQRPGTALGFNVKRANKRTMTGILGSRAPWLGFQEQGGVRTGQSGHLSVPVDARPSPTTVIPRRLRASRLLQRKGFRIPLEGGSVGVFIRERKGGKPTLMWVQRPSVRNEPRLSFAPTARGVIQRSFKKHFDRELQKAIATAR